MKNNNSLISVIVPVYNVEAYLEKCVQSIITQTYKNLEIILVDDGSTDSCPQICDEFAQRNTRIRVIHKANGGLVSARKAGLAVAIGEYIMSVDSDDWIESGMCEELLEALQKSGADFVASGYILRNPNGRNVIKKLPDITFELNSENSTAIIKDWMFKSSECTVNSTVWGKLYKSEIIKKSYTCVPLDMQLGEDFVNYLNLIAMTRKFVCVSKVYYNYMEYEKSMSHTRNLSEFRKYETTYLHCRNIITEKYEIDNETADRWFFMQAFDNLRYYEKKHGHYFQNYFFKQIDLLLGKNVIIYGAGVVGKDYYFQLCRYEQINIVGWVDKSYTTYSYAWKKIEPVESILNKTYDYVIIAIKKETIAKEIQNELVKIGIRQEKLLWSEPDNMIDF